MSTVRALVIFYSRSGNTRRLAQAIAEVGQWDLAEIREPRARTGLAGYLRSGFEAARARATPILPTDRRVDDYDLVVVGTPVWYAALASPVRAFLVENRGRFRDVAFFLTHASMGKRRVFRQMEAAALRTPAATLALREHELRHELQERVRGFVAAAESWTTARPPAPAPAEARAFEVQRPVHGTP